MRYNDKGDFETMSDREIVSSVKKWVAAAILAILSFSFIGWQVGWWFKAENTDRQVEIDLAELRPGHDVDDEVALGGELAGVVPGAVADAARTHRDEAARGVDASRRFIPREPGGTARSPAD